MVGLVIHWLLSALVLLLVARLVPGFRLSGFGSALIAVIIIGLLNATLGLILKIVTFPLTILTLGLFLLVVNAIVLKVVAALMPGFSIQGFLPAFLAAILLAILQVLLRWVFNVV
ncbi:MAG: phage holin family protein [Rhodospirillales bacterium]